MSAPASPREIARTEREVLMTGIGGQGVQLAASILALAATIEEREVMSLGTYGGTMRGGNTDATVVLGDGSLTSPPIVSSAWGLLVMHPRFLDPHLPKLHAESVVLVDSDLLEAPLAGVEGTLFEVPATTLARAAEAPKAAALVLLGAFAELTGLVSAASLGAALERALPSYRQDSLDSNARALVTGADALATRPGLAWPREAT